MRHKEEIRVSRVYNFSAGPAVLPEEVLQEAAAEMMDYKGSGMSVMEMSHRSKWFDDIIKDAEEERASDAEWIESISDKSERKFFRFRKRNGGEKQSEKTGK